MCVDLLDKNRYHTFHRLGSGSVEPCQRATSDRKNRRCIPVFRPTKADTTNNTILRHVHNRLRNMAALLQNHEFDSGCTFHVVELCENNSMRTTESLPDDQEAVAEEVLPSS